MTPLVAPPEFRGRLSRWQSEHLRKRRAQWVVRMNEAGHTASAISEALGISVFAVTRIMRLQGHRLRKPSKARRLSIQWGPILGLADFDDADLDALEEIVTRRNYPNAKAFFKACVIDAIDEEREELGLRKAP